MISKLVKGIVLGLAFVGAVNTVNASNFDVVDSELDFSNKKVGDVFTIRLKKLIKSASAYYVPTYIVLTLLDKDSTNLSNHQANRLQKDTIYVRALLDIDLAPSC